MIDPQIDEQRRRRKNYKPKDDRLSGGSAHIACNNLHRRQRRRKLLVDCAGEPRKINSKGRVRDTLSQQIQHDEARHNEGAVRDAVNLGDAAANCGPKDHEVQRRSNNR